LTRGVLKLHKPANTIAIPGDLTVDEDAAVIWEADGQIAPSASVTLHGSRSSFLHLNGHSASFSRLLLSKAARVRTGQGGGLRVKQVLVDGQRLKDGVYRSPQPWLEGPGSVTVDARVDVQGIIGSPEVAIGPGNIGNLTGDTTIAYPSSGGDYDI